VRGAARPNCGGRSRARVVPDRPGGDPGHGYRGRAVPVLPAGGTGGAGCADAATDQEGLLAALRGVDSAASSVPDATPPILEQALGWLSPDGVGHQPQWPWLPGETLRAVSTPRCMPPTPLSFGGDWSEAGCAPCGGASPASTALRTQPLRHARSAPIHSLSPDTALGCRRRRRPARVCCRSP